MIGGECLDRNQFGAILVAAGLGPPAEHALISLLALNTLRAPEATRADIEHLGLDRGYRTLTVTRKGGKGRHRPVRAAHRESDRPGHRRAHRGTAVPRERWQGLDAQAPDASPGPGWTPCHLEGPQPC